MRENRVSHIGYFGLGFVLLVIAAAGILTASIHGIKSEKELENNKSIMSSLKSIKQREQDLTLIKKIGLVSINESEAVNLILALISTPASKKGLPLDEVPGVVRATAANAEIRSAPAFVDVTDDDYFIIYRKARKIAAFSVIKDEFVAVVEVDG